MNGIVKSHAVPDGLIEMQRELTAEEVEQFRSRWNEDRTTFRITELYSGPTTVMPYPAIRHEVPPVEAFAACPHCRTPPHYPLIVGRIDSDDAMCLIRECAYCHHTWTQQEEI